jgi:methylsterol monooxygenase
MAFTNNYSTSFRWCDRIFGTDDKYRAYKKRLADAKARMKIGTSKEDEKALEQKMLDEVVAEGLRAEAEVETYGKTVKVQ